MTRPDKAGNRARPQLTLAEVDARLTARGAEAEITTEVIAGRETRVWANTPSTFQVLLARVAGHGDRIFLVHDRDRVTYSAFVRAVNHLAHKLVSLGLEPGDRVAIAMRNLPEWPVIFFAIVSAGGIAVPLNAWWKARELGNALTDSGARFLFCDHERWQGIVGEDAAATLKTVFVTRAAELSGQAWPLEAVIGTPDLWAELPDRGPPAHIARPDDYATILYTSGTSGVPKGAVGTHRNLLTCIMSMRYLALRAALRSGAAPAPPAPKVLLLVIPLFHVTGFAANLLPHMWLGSKIVLMGRWNPIDALALIERERVTVTGGVPTIPVQLLDEVGAGQYDISSLEVLTYGGAPAPADLPARINQIKHCVPGNGWGMTETSAMVTGHFGQDYVCRPDSAGPPVPVADIRIVGSEGDMPKGEIGELWVRGPQVISGYWNNPTATADSFVDGWLKTGDLCRIDEDGFLYVVDRAKDVIIRGGENIYSVEVETKLMMHMAVSEAAVFGIPHPILGEVPVAVVSRASGTNVSEVDLQHWLRSEMASFKVPTSILITDQPLPRNENGKVMKKVIREDWLKNEG